MKIVGWVIIYVSDLERSVEFYENKLGIGVRDRPEDDFVELDTEGTIMSLHSGPAAEGLIGRPTGITMTVQNIESVYRSLSEKGVRFSGPPSKQSWGGIITKLVDPDGNEMSLVEMPTS